MENWQFIEENPDYMISDHGRVLSLKGKYKRVLSSEISSTGYEMVLIYQKGIATQHSVHRLVAKAFLPNPEQLPQVNHLDGNRLNNHLSNLEWCDAHDNLMHAILLGICPVSPTSVPCARTDEDGKIEQAYPSINALAAGERMNATQRNWLKLLLSPAQQKMLGNSPHSTTTPKPVLHSRTAHYYRRLLLEEAVALGFSTKTFTQQKNK